MILMNKILIVSSEKNELQKSFVDDFLINILQSKYFVKSICITSKNSIITKTNYDLIIAINKHALTFSSEYFDIPILYIIIDSDYYDEEIYETTCYEKLLFINTIPDINYSVFPLGITEFINYPFLFKEHITTNNTNKNILVCTDYNSIIKLTNVMNNLFDFNIFLHCTNKNINNNILNNNINIIQKNDIDKYLPLSNVVIGSNEIILKALQYGITSFVVGPYGYGGKVNKNNFTKHYNNFFCGRIGSSINEYIPEYLIINDIEYVSKNKKTRSTELQTLVELSLNNSNQKIISIINKTINVNDSIKTNYYIKNSIYNIKIVNSNNSYLIDNRFNKILFELSNLELKIINLFSKPTLITEAINNSKFKNRQTIINIVEELIQNKIIITYEQ